MMGDGKRHYDHATDGAVSEFAGCSVRSLVRCDFLTNVAFTDDSLRPQANIRSKDDVATKARLTYIKGSYLQLELHYKGSFAEILLHADPFAR